MEERGEYVHCVSFVRPDEQEPDRLLPSDETCFKQELEMSDFDSVDPGAAFSQQSGRRVILGKHYDYFDYFGPSLTVVGKGSDRLYGEADDDTLEGNQQADVIHGGRGDDTIIGGPGDDTIRGNQGSDTIYLGEGTDTLLGTAPEDNIIN